MGNNPSNFQACGANCPIEQVSWYEAVDYCNELSARQRLAPCYDADRHFVGLDCEGYRLPTEAEWEYAARAGTQTAFYTGGIANLGCEPLDPSLDPAGWYCGNSNDTTHPVGLKQANSWGLFDMHGNVAEWVNDSHGANDGPMGAATDPLGRRNGEWRRVRGGAWHHVSENARSASIAGNLPANRGEWLGFRPARSLVSRTSSAD